MSEGSGPCFCGRRLYFHCVSRVVNRDFVFGEAVKEAFVRLMRVYERLCVVRVVTFCVMSNHFHVLVGVPRKPAPYTPSPHHIQGQHDTAPEQAIS